MLSRCISWFLFTSYQRFTVSCRKKRWEKKMQPVAIRKIPVWMSPVLVFVHTVSDKRVTCVICFLKLHKWNVQHLLAQKATQTSPVNVYFENKTLLLHIYIDMKVNGSIDVDATALYWLDEWNPQRENCSLHPLPLLVKSGLNWNCCNLQVIHPEFC